MMLISRERERERERDFVVCVCGNEGPPMILFVCFPLGGGGKIERSCIVWDDSSVSLFELYIYT